MACANSTATSSEIEYCHPYWGELIYGTQEQLQSIGIGKGMPFPDGPRKTAKTTCPRGFHVEIKSAAYRGDGVFLASIDFPGRELPSSDDLWIPFSFGVQKGMDWGHDIYVGTEEALCAAGLVQASRLPGKPGGNKCSVTIFPNGRSPTKGSSRKAPAGSVCITKKGKSLYEVSVRISDEECEKRIEKHTAEQRAWEMRMDSLPRPKPLFETKSRSHNSNSMTEFRDNCRSIMRVAKKMILGGAEEHGFQFSSESMARLNFAFSEIYNVIEGGIQHQSNARREGNIIHANFR